MTPAQHKIAAEAILTAMTPDLTGFTIGPSNADQLLGEAHAHLAGTLGTGTHYLTADQLLTNPPDTETGKLKAARLAVTHAILADR